RCRRRSRDDARCVGARGRVARRGVSRAEGSSRADRVRRPVSLGPAWLRARSARASARGPAARRGRLQLRARRRRARPAARAAAPGPRDRDQPPARPALREGRSRPGGAGLRSRHPEPVPTSPGAADDASVARRRPGLPPVGARAPRARRVAAPARTHGSRLGPARVARARAGRVQPDPASPGGLTMWLPPLVLAVAVLGYPLLIAPGRSVLVIGLAALALCALGLVVRSDALVTAGGGLALGEYAFALWLAA